MNWLGVMGVTHPLQAERILELSYLGDTYLMVGVLVNEDLFKGVPTRYRYRYPKTIEDIPEIFSFQVPHKKKVKRSLKFYWQDEDLLTERLFRLVTLGGPELDDIIIPGQPALENLTPLKSAFPTLDIMLDIGYINRRKPGKLDNYRDLVKGIIVKTKEDNDENVEYLKERYPFFELAFKGLHDSELIGKVKSCREAGAVLEEEVRTKDDHLGLTTTSRYLEELAL